MNDGDFSARKKAWYGRAGRIMCGLAIPLLVTLSGSSLPAQTQADEAIQGRAIVFAPVPTEQEEQANGSLHAKAAEMLSNRIVASGFAPERITLLTTPEQTTRDALLQAVKDAADTIQPEEAFLVIVLAPGTHSEGIDSVRTQQSGPNGGSVDLQDIIRQMSTSASQNRALIIDGAWDAEAASTEAQQRFGTGEVPARYNQWVVINRSNALSRHSKSAGSITAFAQALLDGLSWHADTDADGYVSLFELSEYLKLCAEGQDLPAPRMLGKTNADFAVAVANDQLEGDLTTTDRQENANVLFSAAQRALFAELDGEAALEQLTRAGRLLPHNESQERIRGLSLAAEALNGDVAVAWTRAQAKKSPLFVLLEKSASVIPAKNRSGENQVFPAGTVFKVTALHEKRLIWVKEAVRPRLRNGVISFERLEISPGWVRIKDLGSDNAVTGPLESMLSELYDAS